MNDLDLCLEVVLRSCQALCHIRHWISRKPLIRYRDLVHVHFTSSCPWARILCNVAVLTCRAVNGSCTWVPVVRSYFTRVANVPSRLRFISIFWFWKMVPSYNLTNVGCRRAFPVFAANLWNSLPANLTSAPSLTTFRQRLKTHLFRRSYPDLIIWHSDL